jgi:hypothetical protein
MSPLCLSAEIAIALNNYIMQKRTPKDDQERGVIE